MRPTRLVQYCTIPRCRDNDVAQCRFNIVVWSVCCPWNFHDLFQDLQSCIIIIYIGERNKWWTNLSSSLSSLLRFEVATMVSAFVNWCYMSMLQRKVQMFICFVLFANVFFVPFFVFFLFFFCCFCLCAYCASVFCQYLTSPEWNVPCDLNPREKVQ